MVGFGKDNLHPELFRKHQVCNVFCEFVEITRFVRSQNWDGKVKSFKFKARESRVMRRTHCTPQSQRDEAQRRNWTFYEAIRDYFGGLNG